MLGTIGSRTGGCGTPSENKPAGAARDADCLAALSMPHNPDFSSGRCDADGYSIPAPTDGLEPAAARHRFGSARPRAGRSRGAVLVVLAAIALVVVPVAIVEWPREIARWHEAAAKELHLQDDTAAAVASMDRAIAWNGQDAALFLQRAEYKLQTGQWQSGLEDCDEARRLNPDNPLVGQWRSQFLQHLGRHREAVAQLREVLQVVGSVLPAERALQLNNLAYAAAVGDLDLNEALAAAEESLRIQGDVAAILDPAGVLCFGRAVTAHARGDSLLALSTLSEAREQAEAVLQVVAQQIESHDPKDTRRSLALPMNTQPCAHTWPGSCSCESTSARNSASRKTPCAISSDSRS